MADLNDALGVDSPEEFFAQEAEGLDEEPESTAECLDYLADRVLAHYEVMRAICQQNLDAIPEEEIPTEGKASLMADMEVDKLIIGIAFALATQYLEEREEEDDG